MTPTRSVTTCFRKYADFTGTASRSEFWWFALFNAVVGGLLVLAAGGHSRVLADAWSLVVLVPGLAVAVRRLRDARYPWPFLLFGLIPVVGAVLLFFFLQPTATSPSGPRPTADRSSTSM